GSGRWARFLAGFERYFERGRERYRAALERFVAHRALGLAAIGAMIVASFLLLFGVGEDFFPTVDAGMMRLHVRMPTGTGIEKTEWVVDQIERAIREVVPASELAGISDNVGLPVSYDLAFYQTDTIGPQDADVLVQLQPTHAATAGYEVAIRDALGRRFPNVTTYFQAADIVSQILHFGLPAAIDVQISGMDLHRDAEIAGRLRAEMAKVPGITDLRIAEPLDYPAFRVEVDRAKALELGMTETQVASSLLTSLSGNSLLQPTFWLDPKNGVNYTVISQT